MNIISNKTDYTAHEAKQLGAPSNWFIAFDGTTAVGQADDSIVGTFELTRSRVKADKFHTMKMFHRSQYLPSIVEDREYTGREVISMTLEETPINYSGRPTYYDPSLAAHIKYDPTEISTKIIEGKHISGVLDKAAIGGGTSGNIYHIIANEYGPQKALDVIYDMQQVSIGYVLQSGFTIGVMDMLVSDNARREINEISTDIINKSALVTEKLNNGEIIPPIGTTVEQFYEEQQISTLSVYDDFTETIIKDIDIEANNLFKLIACGSKGKLPNMYNMTSSIGQKLINGERIRQKFGHKRTNPYYPRFDTSPQARGYIANSYINGVNSAEYIAGAMNARFDLITKALSTSVTGEQNRKSVKNLESLKVNNHGWATKDNNVVQMSFGEDSMDVRRVETAIFHTVMMSDDEFSKNFKGADKEEFEALKKDRDHYRAQFMKLEEVGINNLMTDRKKVAINMDRIIETALFANFKARNEKAPSAKEITAMIKKVKEFLDDFAYAQTNAYARERRWALPEHMIKSVWLVTMLIRSYLCSTRFEKGYKNIMGIIGFMNMDTLNVVLETIINKYKAALIAPGTAVGIIAAQSFSEPLTQYMLDAHHRSAAGGTSNDAMVKTKEVLGAKDVSKLAMPRMMIQLSEDIRTDKARVQELANNIEVMRLKQFVTKWGIFFEKFGEPIHPLYTRERAMIEKFSKMNPLARPPIDLVRWCIRYSINKTSLILKNMSLETIIEKLRETFSGTFIVYTPENSDEIVIRVYMRATNFKEVDLPAMREFNDKLLDCAVRGIMGITNTTVTQLIRNKIMPDGSIARDNNVWGIATIGTNMSEILSIKHVDQYGVQTDALHEIVEIYGIEAARQRIITEMKILVDKCDYRHLSLYADEMTYTGTITSIDKSGMGKREDRNNLLRIGTAAPVKVMESAALNASVDKITGITSAFLLGTVPETGSIYNSFIVNEEFIAANVKSLESVLDEL
jgi:DNA-directed RNA polymerase beta' subunit